MPAKVLHVVAVEDGEEGFEIGVLSVQHLVPTKAGRPRERLVGRHEDRCGLIHVGKIFPEPFQLFGGKVLLIFAAMLLAGLDIGEVHVVHHDVVDLSEVEGIVIGREILGVLEGLEIVAGNLHLVVVIAHRVEEGDPAEIAVHRLEIIGEPVIVRQPVHIPGHVAEGEAIDLAGRGIDGLIHETGHLLELGQVAGPAGQVHIAEDKQRVIVIGGRIQRKINLLRHIGIGRERLPEIGENTVQRGFIAAGNRDENVFPLLGGLQPVTAVRIGLDDIDSVGDKDALYRRSVAGDGTEDIGREVGRIRDGCRIHPARGVCLGRRGFPDHHAAVGIGDDNLENIRGQVHRSDGEEPGRTERDTVGAAHLYAALGPVSGRKRTPVGLEGARQGLPVLRDQADGGNEGVTFPGRGDGKEGDLRGEIEDFIRGRCRHHIRLRIKRAVIPGLTGRDGDGRSGSGIAGNG